MEKQEKKVSKRIEFAPSKSNKQLIIPSKYFLDDIRVTELEYYGITPDTTLEEVMKEEPSDSSKFNEWQIKVSLVKQRDGDPSNPLSGIFEF